VAGEFMNGKISPGKRASRIQGYGYISALESFCRLKSFKLPTQILSFACREQCTRLGFGIPLNEVGGLLIVFPARALFLLACYS
jgi:hypothetical protein